MTLDPAVHKEITDIVASDDVVLFMKGRKSMPQCGFSATVVQILNQHVPSYTTVNVLSNPQVREGIKAFSDWPTIPQLYIKGEFVGGCDIIKDLESQGQLAGMLGAEVKEVAEPKITLTESAQAALEDAVEDGEEKRIRIEVSPDYRYNLGFDATQDSDFQIQSLNFTIVIDRSSASRSENIVIDFETKGEASGFKITNDAEPAKVAQLTAAAVKAKLDAGETFDFLDVRTPEERQIACIETTKHLDETLGEAIKSGDKDRVLVFHCHHGARSQQAAEHFLAAGFSKVFNMTGGIDAWSSEVDASVPKY